DHDPKRLGRLSINLQSLKSDGKTDPPWGMRIDRRNCQGKNLEACIKQCRMEDITRRLSLECRRPHHHRPCPAAFAAATRYTGALESRAVLVTLRRHRFIE